MPWKVFPSGNEYCVHKLNSDGSKGPKVNGGCHETRQEADDHMSALYANEPKSLVKSAPMESTFMVVKDGSGAFRWVAQFTNNVRDDDLPPEILSAESHRRFVYMVEKGLVDYPEFWVWHNESWAIGDTDWVALDEKGGVTFVLASGTFRDYAKEVAVALAQTKGVALSHGMYPHLIERDTDDPTVITGYVSREISVLPREFAANKLTAYSMTEITKMVDEKRRSELLERFPALGEHILNGIEAANEKAAEAAKGMGLETKESSEEEEVEETEAKEEGNEETAEEKESTESGEDTKAEGEEQDTPAEEEEEEEENKSSAEAAAQAGVVSAEFMESLADALFAIDNRLKSVEGVLEDVSSLQDRVKEIEESRTKESKKTRAMTILDAINKSSVEGKEETRVDGRSSLSKSGPEENKDRGGTGLFFEEFMNG